MGFCWVYLSEDTPNPYQVLHVTQIWLSWDSFSCTHLGAEKCRQQQKPREGNTFTHSSLAVTQHWEREAAFKPQGLSGFLWRTQKAPDQPPAHDNQWQKQMMTAELHWEAKLGWKPTAVCFAPATNCPKSLQDKAGEGSAAEQTDARAGVQ